MENIPILKFEPNRVRRLYLGGAGIDRLQGRAPAEDGYFPEEWIASCIEGNTREFQAPGHGLSRVRTGEGEMRFIDLLREQGAELLGERHFKRYGATPAVLTKLLDSAIRLPVQCHPTVADAKRLWNAPCGKTEAWIILSARPDSYIFLGFNGKFDWEVFLAESLAGEYRRGFEMMHRIPVSAGEVYVVYGGLPHAIGPGVTMVEVMEPSDLTINPEARCGDREISPEKRFGGIDPRQALEVFERTGYSASAIRERCAPKPEPLPGGGLRLIDRDRVGFFGAERYRVSGAGEILRPEPEFRIGVVAAGSVEIGGMGLRCGESFFIPYGAGPIRAEGDGELVVILPPRA